jgi:hypothetical protein
MLKDYTIVRKRVITQIMSTTVQAESQKKALAELNEDNSEFYEDGNEWHPLEDSIKYLKSTANDVLESEEVYIDPREVY